MSEYTPDVWVIVKITDVKNSTCIYKVLAGWHGGFAGADSWQLNSGITRIEDMGNYYDFYGSSGSVYSCAKHSERMSTLTWSKLQYFNSDPSTALVEVVPVEEAIKILS